MRLFYFKWEMYKINNLMMIYQKINKNNMNNKINNTKIKIKIKIFNSMMNNKTFVKIS